MKITPLVTPKVPCLSTRRNRRWRGVLATVAVAVAAVSFGAAQEAEAASPPSPPNKLKSNDPGNFGVGAMLGNPTGLSLKWFTSNRHAVQAGIGWSYNLGLRGHLDWLYHPGKFVSNDVLDLVPYFGLGFGVSALDDRISPWSKHAFAGVRPVVFGRLPALGLAIHWRKVPFDVFAEVAWTPTWIVGWGPDFRPYDSVIGGRFYF